VRPLVHHSALAGALFYATFAVWMLGELALQVRTQGPERRDPSRLGMIAGVGGGVALAFILAGEASFPGPRWLPVAVGLVVAWLGIVLRAWAVRTLGEFFTVDVTVTAGQRVIEHGPYARLRHPSYTGMLLAIVGFGIALDSWPGAAAALLLPLAAVVIRIRHEEATLRRELGAAYVAYAQRTNRLVPGVW
jgi:protein-S-isoprenylcysteine O-methyltransferase Ste14